MSEPQEQTSSDEELDVTSSKFNPLKALYSEKFKIPFPDARKFDNVATFLSRLKQAGGALDADLDKAVTHHKKKEIKEVQEVNKEKYHVTVSGRTFLKEQGLFFNAVNWKLLNHFFSFTAPVYRGPKAKYKRDIFVKMETAIGPIALLNKFRMNRTRVKIYIRKEHGIRGYITGFIETFDKHYNIALVDCIEVWKRRKYKFSESSVSLLGQPEDCSNLLKSMRINVPEISTKSVDRKVVECTRKIPQLMLRGENVILIGEDISQPKSDKAQSTVKSWEKKKVVLSLKWQRT